MSLFWLLTVDIIYIFIFVIRQDYYTIYDRTENHYEASLTIRNSYDGRCLYTGTGTTVDELSNRHPQLRRSPYNQPNRRHQDHYSAGQ